MASPFRNKMRGNSDNNIKTTAEMSGVKSNHFRNLLSDFSFTPFQKTEGCIAGIKRLRGANTIGTVSAFDGVQKYQRT